MFYHMMSTLGYGTSTRLYGLCSSLQQQKQLSVCLSICLSQSVC